MSDALRDACHELNNVLGTVLVSADVGGKRSAVDKDRELFDIIAASTRRAGELVARLSPLVESADDGAAARDLKYLDGLHAAMPPVVAELEEHCKRDDIPLMDRAGVRLLATIVAAVRADKILELGTAYGYSALCMALAQGPAGQITTIDPDTARTDIARSYFARAGVAGRITVVNQPALDAIASMSHPPYDLVFIDAVKAEYAAYLEAALPHMRTSGVVVVDNLLWSHRSSAAPADHDDASTRAIREFNRTFLSHPALSAVIVPVGDGVGFGVKVK
ncbi:MAG TPA: class I SAM-dependent methyltransferase [Candidatus Eremiobacteraceae bacterium]